MISEDRARAERDGQPDCPRRMTGPLPPDPDIYGLEDFSGMLPTPEYRKALAVFLASLEPTPEEREYGRLYRREQARQARLAVARGHKDRMARLRLMLDVADGGPDR